MFTEGFPDQFQEAYLHVISIIRKETVNGISSGIADGYNSDKEIYYLSDGSRIRFPYRIYFEDDDCVYSSLGNSEKAIYDCIFTRHCDGYVREKHLRNLLDAELQEWFLPYILRLSSEYVVEIVELLYETIKDRDNTVLQTFCHNNPEMLKRSYTRMTSYWECYYKMIYPEFELYVGRKLFKECMSPHTNFEKL